MKRQGLVSKGTPSRIFHEAAEAWNRQDYQKAIDLHEKARAREPGNPAILLDLGRAYGMRYDYANAERCLEMANQHPIFRNRTASWSLSVSVPGRAGQWIQSTNRQSYNQR